MQTQQYLKWDYETYPSILAFSYQVFLSQRGVKWSISTHILISINITLTFSLALGVKNTLVIIMVSPPLPGIISETSPWETDNLQLSSWKCQIIGLNCKMASFCGILSSFSPPLLRKHVSFSMSRQNIQVAHRKMDELGPYQIYNQSLNLVIMPVILLHLN